MRRKPALQRSRNGACSLIFARIVVGLGKRGEERGKREEGRGKREEERGKRGRWERLDQEKGILAHRVTQPGARARWVVRKRENLVGATRRVAPTRFGVSRRSVFPTVAVCWTREVCTFARCPMQTSFPEAAVQARIASGWCLPTIPSTHTGCSNSCRIRPHPPPCRRRGR